MPQVSGNPIVESGSNSDGEWTRWADGTQICSSTIVRSSYGGADSSKSVQGVTIYRWDPPSWDFPNSFISDPTVSLTGNIQGTGYSLIALFVTSTTTSDTNCMFETLADSTDDVIEYWTATGRWF